MKIRDLRQGAWSWVHHKVLDDYGADLGAYGLSTYLALLRFADREQSADPSIAEMAKLVSISERKIQEEILHLCELGLIRVERKLRDKGGGSDRNTYFLLDPPLRQSLLFPDQTPATVDKPTKEPEEKKKDPRIHAPEIQLYRKIVHFYPHESLRDTVIAKLRGVSEKEAHAAFANYMHYGGNPKSLKWLDKLSSGVNQAQDQWAQTNVEANGEFNL